MQISEYLLKIENSNDILTRTKILPYPFVVYSRSMHIITNHIYVFIVGEEKRRRRLRRRFRPD